MIFAIDFDGTLVSQDRPYDDLETPLQLLPGAKEALRSLKAAGHTVVVFSARASAWLRIDPLKDPLVTKGLKKVDFAEWQRKQPLHEARYQEMRTFCHEELAGLVDAVDDGVQGKPQADVFIDDRAIRFDAGAHVGFDWNEIRSVYGAGR